MAKPSVNFRRSKIIRYELGSAAVTARPAENLVRIGKPLYSELLPRATLAGGTLASAAGTAALPSSNRIIFDLLKLTLGLAI